MRACRGVEGYRLVSRGAQLFMLSLLVLTKAQTPTQTLVVGQPVAINGTNSATGSFQTMASVTGPPGPPTGTWPAATGGTWAGTGAGGWPATATAAGAWPGAPAGGAPGGAAGGCPGAGGGAGGQGGWNGASGGAGGWQGGAGGGKWMIPEWVATIPPAKIAHATLGSMAVLFVFPLGGIVHRVWYHYHNVWVHAAIQMMGYLLFLSAAAIGLYMGAVEKKLVGFHPIMGMILLAGFTLQPFTELINYFLYRRWPKIKYVGYVHIWKGRTLLLVGMIHGGLGFAYAAKLDGELQMRKGPWPRVVPILYGIIACLVAIAYASTITWTQVKAVRRMSQTSMAPEDMVENGLAFRLEEHTFSQVRASIKRASESAQGGTNESKAASEAGPTPPKTGTTLPESSSPTEGTVSPTSPAQPTSTTPAASGVTPSRMSSVKRIFRSDAL